MEIEEGIIALLKTSLQTKSPQEKTASKASANKASFASVVRKGSTEQEKQGTLLTTTVVVTFNIRIGKGEAPLKQFKKLIGLRLSTIKENLDEHICIVIIEDNVTGLINSSQNIPKLILGMPKFVHIPNIRAFSSTQQNSQMIKCLARMSF